MSRYRIERIQEEGKADLFQPQVLFELNNIESALKRTPYWENIIKIGTYVNTKEILHKYLGVEADISESQTWDTKEKAMEVINLHKKQTEPKIIKEYINVE